MSCPDIKLYSLTPIIPCHNVIMLYVSHGLAAAHLICVKCILQDYLGFKTELDRREPLYLKIGEKVLSGRALKITRPDWEKLDILWQETDEKVSIALGIWPVYI